MNKKFKERVIDFKTTNERLCTIRLKTTFFNLWLVNCDSPREEKDVAVKDELYNTLERVCDALPSNDF